MQRYGFEYIRTGPRSYRIQVQSYNGGYLSTAIHTNDRGRVGSYAKDLAVQSQDFLADDGILHVVDTNARSVDGHGYLILSTYRWKDGRWTYSHGTKISNLEAE